MAAMIAANGAPRSAIRFLAPRKEIGMAKMDPKVEAIRAIQIVITINLKVSLDVSLRPVILRLRISTTASL
jgi:hypothetical protein